MAQHDTATDQAALSWRCYHGLRCCLCAAPIPHCLKGVMTIMKQLTAVPASSHHSQLHQQQQQQQQQPVHLQSSVQLVAPMQPLLRQTAVVLAVVVALHRVWCRVCWWRRVSWRNEEWTVRRQAMIRWLLDCAELEWVWWERGGGEEQMVLG